MSNKNDLWEELNTVFREVFNNKNLNITFSTSNNDIDGWTSLNHALLIDALEKKFQIAFDLDEILTMQSVADIFGTIEKKINK